MKIRIVKKKNKKLMEKIQAKLLIKEKKGFPFNKIRIVIWICLLALAIEQKNIHLGNCLTMVLYHFANDNIKKLAVWEAKLLQLTQNLAKNSL